MKNESMQLSLIRENRIRAQGYFSQTSEKVNQLAFGNKFAYKLCTTILILGIITSNIYALVFINLVAFLAVVLPYHPFDYIYNGLLAKSMNKPKLPPRSNQLKFACAVATPWIGGTIFLFYTEQMTAGYVLGSVLALVALSVSLLDLCIPSIIYNKLFLKKGQTL
jgi:uncharacterized protein DUF4395